MARSDRARRWARWLAAHRWWQHGLRWLLMAVVGMPLVVICAASGFPEWTLGVCVLLMLIMDDAVGRYVKRWSAEPAGADDERACG
ncbi:hypothetical protein ABTZ58_16395 [Streptomyces sp. NPDC094143]|uniref:hypothetical protein n=1 Tax=Streptomyces sp. NPDC094143 TaxID=3155310 RepID=UPI003332F4FB